MNVLQQFMEAVKQAITVMEIDTPNSDVLDLCYKALHDGEAELEREPLTDKRIIEIRKSTNTKENTAWADTLAFARAILTADRDSVVWGVDWGKLGDRTSITIVKRRQDGTIEVVATEVEPK